MKVAKYSTYEMRVRAVQAVKNGQPVSQVAKSYQTNATTIYRWIKKYDETGSEEGLVRKPGSGRPRKLKDIDPDQLKDIILQPASNFGYETDFWTCKRLRDVLVETCKISVSKWTIWRRLREANITYQKPERQYYEASQEQRDSWMDTELPRILKAVDEYKAILYFEDESNISLTTVLGKTWAPCGETPIQEVTGNRSSVSAMSAISGSGFLLFSLHEKRIASDEVIHFLEQMLKHHKRRHLFVVMDQAPPHTSKKTKEFIKKQKRLHVFYLPPYSPDWNPDEKVWNHLSVKQMRFFISVTVSVT